MQAKTIEIIIKVVEIIATSLSHQKTKKGGHKNDGTGSAKKK